METIPTNSSLLAGAAYDAERQELVLTFKRGATWAYSGFSPDDLNDFRSASSQGKHFLQFIKGSYPERRV